MSTGHVCSGGAAHRGRWQLPGALPGGVAAAWHVANVHCLRCRHRGCGTTGAPPSHPPTRLNLASRPLLIRASCSPLRPTPLLRMAVPCTGGPAVGRPVGTQCGASGGGAAAALRPQALCWLRATGGGQRGAAQALGAGGGPEGAGAAAVLRVQAAGSSRRMHGGCAAGVPVLTHALRPRLCPVRSAPYPSCPPPPCRRSLAATAKR